MKLLYINKNINLSQPIIAQLNKMGFEVDVLIESLPKPSDRFSVFDRFFNIFSRVILKDKFYFLNKEKKRFQAYAEKKLKKKTYDYALFMRADMYPASLIRKVRKQSRMMVNYQWDGLDMYPGIFDFIPFFDRFFVFDSFDIQKYPQYHFLPLTNFHYNENHVKTDTKFDFFYVGVGLEERIRWTHNLEKFCDENGLKLKAIMTIPDFREEKITDSVSLQHNGISLKENDAYASNAKTVIDYKLKNHNGASFRVFECMAREQKLISNNPNLKDYDFYHPDNIFFTDFEDFTGLGEFLEKPYHKLDQKIVEKYSIGNWLKYALDFGEYEPIDLPLWKSS